MKIMIQHGFWTVFFGLLFTNFSMAQETASQTDKEIIHWLQQNSIPIEHVKAENGFSDLQPLKKVLKNVKVVGLGENTHGSREFFQLKHRMLEFLVTEMGFQGVAFESSYAPCVAINDYVLYGKGNREDVLTGQGYVVWDTEEVSDMIDWMRNYNKNVPDEKKVRFYGLDFGYNEAGAKKVSAYLKKTGTLHTPAIDTLLQTIGYLGKENWPMKMDEVQNELKESMPRLQNLIGLLVENKEKLTIASNAHEFKEVLMYTHVMEQFLRNTIQDSIPESASGNMVRSRSMATNLFRILDLDKSAEKVVVWAHNVHISIGKPETGEANMGYELKDKYGDAYYAIGLEFDRGANQSRLLLPDKSLGNLKTITMIPAPEGYLTWYLSHSTKGSSFFNLHAPIVNNSVQKWIDTPQTFRGYGWLSHVKSLKKISLLKRYEGILFIEYSTPSRPTPNAINSVSKLEGY